jgi:hypothetical protein
MRDIRRAPDAQRASLAAVLDHTPLRRVEELSNPSEQGGRMVLRKDWALLEVNGAERVVHRSWPRHGTAMPWDLR